MLRWAGRVIAPQGGMHAASVGKAMSSKIEEVMLGNFNEAMANI